MVRRGSTVRVRQRALQKRRKPRLSSRIDLQTLHHAVGMEPVMEPSGREVVQTGAGCADQSARIWETLGGGHHAREIASAKGERPMSRRSIFLVVSLVASVGLLPTAAVANVPNNEAATYRLVTPIPNIGDAPNGDHAAI